MVLFFATIRHNSQQSLPARYIWSFSRFYNLLQNQNLEEEKKHLNRSFWGHWSQPVNLLEEKKIRRKTFLELTTSGLIYAATVTSRIESEFCMLLRFCWGRKPGKKNWNQERDPTNSTHMSCWVWESNLRPQIERQVSYRYPLISHTFIIIFINISCILMLNESWVRLYLPMLTYFSNFPFICAELGEAHKNSKACPTRV